MRSLFLAVLTIAVTFPVSVTTVSAQYTWRSALESQDTGSTVRWGRVRFSPTVTNTVWAARSNFPDPELPAPPDGDGLWGSNNNGSTWNRVNSGPFLDTYNVLDFAFCDADGNTAYAATNAGGVFKTVDGGSTWTDVSAGISYDGAGFPNDVWGVTSVGVDPVDCDRVYIGIGNLSGLDITNPAPDHPGFFYSDDGGATWNENNAGLPARNDDIGDLVSETTAIQSIATSANEPNVVYMSMVQIQVNLKIFGNKTATSDALVYKNTSGGAGTWELAGSGLPSVSQSSALGSLARVSVAGSFIEAFPHANTTVLFVAHFGYGQLVTLGGGVDTQRNRGVFALVPGGGAWIPRNSGLPVVNDAGNDNSINATCLAVRPGDVYTLLNGVSNSESAGLGNSNVWATLTAGAPWFNNWSTGLEEAGDFGEYFIANANFVAFNRNGTRAAATLSWDDGTQPEDTPVDGVYMLP